MATTPFMNLELPTVSVTVGPDWAEAINTALDAVDEHDHSSGKGKKVKTNGLQIDGNLTFATYKATEVGAVKFMNLSVALTGAANANSVYSLDGDLYFTNSAGSAVQITDGGSVVTTPASLSTVQSDNINTDLIIAPSDVYVLLRVDTSAPRSITLPLSANVTNGRIYIIKDVTQSAFQNPITILTSGSDTIDGESSYVIESDSESAWLIADGVSAYDIA